MEATLGRRTSIKSPGSTCSRQSAARRCRLRRSCRGRRGDGAEGLPAEQQSSRRCPAPAAEEVLAAQARPCYRFSRQPQLQPLPIREYRHSRIREPRQRCPFRDCSRAKSLLRGRLQTCVGHSVPDIFGTVDQRAYGIQGISRARPPHRWSPGDIRQPSREGERRRLSETHRCAPCRLRSRGWRSGRCKPTSGAGSCSAR